MTVLFIHGLASSGSFKTATSLHHLLRPCDVVSPDVPIDPEEALTLLQKICAEAEPDLVVGLSMGGFWAQKLHGYRKILINPDFHISELLQTRIGEVGYLSPRRNGAKSFTVTKDICRRYAEIENHQFDDISDAEVHLTGAMFADSDELVDCSAEFEIYYPGQSIHYPGGHLPTHPELKQFLLPLIASAFPELAMESIL